MEKTKANEIIKTIRKALRKVADGGSTYRGTDVRQNSGYLRSCESYEALENKLSKKPKWFDLVYYLNEYNHNDYESLRINHTNFEAKEIVKVLDSLSIDYRWDESEYSNILILFDGYEEYDKNNRERILTYEKLTLKYNEPIITLNYTGNLDKDVNIAYKAYIKADKKMKETEVSRLANNAGISYDLAIELFDMIAAYSSHSWECDVKAWHKNKDILKKNIEGKTWFTKYQDIVDYLKEDYDKFLANAGIYEEYINGAKWFSERYDEYTINSLLTFYVIKGA